MEDKRAVSGRGKSGVQGGDCPGIDPAVEDPMIVVTHEIAFARQVADSVIFMDEGEIILQGSAQEVIDRPENERIRRFMQNLSTF